MVTISLHVHIDIPGTLWTVEAGFDGHDGIFKMRGGPDAGEMSIEPFAAVATLEALLAFAREHGPAAEPRP